MRQASVIVLGILLLAGCSMGGEVPVSGGGPLPGGETARVVQVIDGDTIDVNLNGEQVRVRYVGVNTPERDQSCYSEARAANSSMVSGQTVTLLRDTSDTDQYGRLLRYIYVGDTFVNEQLVRGGWAEVVVYQPDDQYADDFRMLEQQAAQSGLGCHPSGIFDDGSYTR
ncbi:MAG: thermonuclease family protein [Anaerolineae bacterium]|nr:thermonuclease family protein [Anaerolineae bacterium]